MVEKVSKVVLNIETNALNNLLNPKKQQKDENLSEILAGKEKAEQAKQEDLSEDENKSFFQSCAKQKCVPQFSTSTNPPAASILPQKRP